MIGLRHGKMQDGAAGLLLAAIAVPEQLATAHLAGMPAEAGLYTFVAGGLGFALFGTNRFLSAGADSTVAPIFAGGLAVLALAGTPHYVALAGLLAVMVGVLLVGAAVLRAGWVADLLSVPVVVGFMAGIAVHIVVGQLPIVLGVTGGGGTLPDRVVALWSHRSDTNLWTLGIGLGILAITRATDAVMPRVPGALLALVLASCSVAVWQPPVEMLAVLHPAMPALAMPSFAEVYALAPLALIVAMVCMMQTAAVLRAYPSQPEGPLHVARDFAGIGAGSILAGLIGGFPVNASPPRTAVAVEAGAGSQWASLVAVALGLALLFGGGDLLAFLPHAALGGILIGVAMRLFRLGEMVRIARCGGTEILLVLASALLVVLLPIQTGAILGVVFSLLHGFYIVARPHCTELARAPGTTVWWPPDDGGAEYVPGVLVFAPAAPVNFTNASFIRAALKAAIERAATPVRLVVIEASGTIDIDYTGAGVLIRYIAYLRARGIDVALARLSAERAVVRAERTGLLDAFGRDRVFRTVEEAIGVRGSFTPRPPSPPVSQRFPV
ncbi:MAG: SulP family inorganic anion transporter [Rhodospirillales bacterium]